MKIIFMNTSEIYKDDRWYIVKPLSYYTAKIYGASTKWCTSSRETPKQFYEYSKEGILLYVIDRALIKNGQYTGQYGKGPKRKCLGGMHKDNRIDSIQVDIPFGIMNEVKNHLFKEKKPNITYFSEESLINLKKLLKLDKENRK